MKRLEDVYGLSRKPGLRKWTWLLMFMLVVLVSWSLIAKLDEVSVAVGEVVPQGQIKTIQHLEGGIIKNIFVAEGDVVARGAPLVQLDIVSSDSVRAELSVRLDGLLLAAARLKGQALGKAPDYDLGAVARHPGLARSERERFRAYEAELKSTLSVLNERVHERELEARQIKTKIETLDNDLVLAREEFVMSDDLLKDGLTSKLDHLRLQREVETIEGGLAELAVALPRARAGVEVARREAKSQVDRYRRLSSEDLGKTELEIAQTREGLAQATDRVRRLEIQSPIDGIVKSLRYHTIGGVVRPGEALMEIVPTLQNLVIEARLDPSDVGYVRVGQDAIVKITTYDFVRYGALDGKVIDISPDSDTDPDGNTYFRLVVRTDKTYLGDEAGQYPITSGMQATVDVHTGRKSVFNYMLTPVLKLKYEAFRER